MADPASGPPGRRRWPRACRSAGCALLGLVACLAAAPRARACECPAPGEGPGPGVSAIFEGRVVTIGRADDGQRELLLKVTRSFRGPQRETLRVRAGSLEVCGGVLSAGETYLVYASGPARDLRTDRCLGTRPMAGADADVARLGVGAIPVDPPTDDARRTRPAPLTGPAAGGCASCHLGAGGARAPGVLGTLVLWGLLWRRRSTRSR